MSRSPWGAEADAGTRSQSFSGTSNVIGVDLGGTKVAVAALRGINLGDALVKFFPMGGMSPEMVLSAAPGVTPSTK